jgi:hypothetical protein
MRALALVLGLLAVAAEASAADFIVQGTFQYEDRIFDQYGYTGTVQDLPIRHADVEVVNASNGSVLASGSTTEDGTYSIPVTGLSGSVTLYVRCLSSTDNAANYHLKVVDTFQRVNGTVDLSGSTVHAVTTTDQTHDTSIPLLDMGLWLIQDTTGSGVAQAFNILDAGVDTFDYLHTSAGIGRWPTAGEFLVYGWNGTSGSDGSNYFWHGIYITSNSTDTDGWADAVILHETGHWATDMFGNDQNPGGVHYIGDIDQDPRLSYGEGYATFFMGQVREFRAAFLNGSGQPKDDHVSFYADLGIPPAVGTPGGLGFAYDFETGLYQNGTPLGQVGTACETSVTSAMWDVIDGVHTPDETPLQDDDPVDDTGALTWQVITEYMTKLNPPSHWITVEDFYRGWFAVHGAGFMKTGVDSSFIGLAGMDFFADAYEPDDDTLNAVTVAPGTYNASGTGRAVLNELDLGSEDKIEVMNPGTTPVVLTGWKIKTYRNDYPLDSTRIYTFPAFTLYPGGFVVVHEGGDPAQNGATDLYGGTFSVVWANGDDGACTLENGSGTAQDFVRWDNVSGSDPNTTPVPSGTSWSGTLLSAPLGNDLARDADGTDTDAAADFSSLNATMGAPNFASVAFHTIFPAGDRDVIRVNVGADDLMVVRAFSPHSAGEPRVELLDDAGNLLGSARATHGFSALGELQAYFQDATHVFARVSHVGPYTEWAPVELMVYRRPVAAVLSPPVALTATPANTADVADPVTVTWLNGGAYDEVQVSRDGGAATVLSGTATSLNDTADRGLHTYTVTGWISGASSPPATVKVFAGVLDCTVSDGLESGTSGFVLDAPWNRTSTRAASGSWSLTDSPSGNYANDADVSATLLAPVLLSAYPRLEFDHICITEEGYDYGRVEISADFGNSWSELARYDMGSYPEWSDGTADPGDWKHEIIDLNDYAGKKVIVRFRLVSDSYVTEDGWYVDNVTLSDPTCRTVTGVPGSEPGTDPMLTAGPNPFSGRLGLLLSVRPGERARVEVFDAAGRRVRTLFDGAASRGSLDLVWDGRDEVGRRTAAGVYLIRARTPEASTVRRVVRLP